MPTAKLKKREQINQATFLLTFTPDEPLHFIGGQFIIVDSGMKNEEGKNYKRTYSFLSNDENQNEFQIVYKVLEKGIITNTYLKNLEVGETITFSGPWGKFLSQEEYFGEGEVFVMATDTAIASALSFVNSKKLKNKEKTSFYWMVPGNDYFLDFESVKKRLPKNLAKFEIIQVPEFGTAQRSTVLEKAKEIAEKHSKARTVLLAGDGKVVHELKDYLLDKGISENHIGTEVYFNKDRV